LSDQALYRRTLRRALEIVGSQVALQQRIHVPEKRLAAWLQGVQPVPDAVFLQLVDIVVNTAEASPPAPPPVVAKRGYRSA
jgi:hypothetical protein